jgi:hypothetical protein
MGASRSRGRSTAQNLPTSSDEVPLSSDGERATALRPGRTDPVAVLPRSARPYFWTVSLRETQYVQAQSASILRAPEAPFYGSFTGAALMELHGSFPLARLLKNKVSLCETQYAEAPMPRIPEAELERSSGGRTWRRWSGQRGSNCGRTGRATWPGNARSMTTRRRASS